MSLVSDERCPRCNARHTLFIGDEGRVTCSLCGYKERPAPSTSPPADTNTHIRARNYTVSYSIEHRGDVESWTRASYHTGLDHIRRKEYDQALRAFQRSLDNQRDFLDAHLWIARLIDDPEIRRKHYSEVIAHIPNHQEAIRELMVMNGQLTADESARVADASHEPQRIRAGAPVKADVQAQTCPLCAGTMRADIEGKRAQCVACGHIVTHESDRGYGLQSVAMAMLKQRGQAIVWEVGSHVWHCDHCGAEQIISGRMTRYCPFCGSSQVMRVDALASFQQPDSIIPFTISKANAQKRLRQALNSRIERFKGFFVQNKIASARMQATFVPVWYFDAVVEVNRSITPKTSYHARQAQIKRDKLTEMAHNVGVAGVDSPPRYLLERIDNYDLQAVIPYKMELLAGYHAQLYTRDFERAMFIARSSVGDKLRTRYDTSTTKSEVRVSVMFQQMFFRLVLVPVYTATLLEVDGDIRPAVINGQTGVVALGRAEKVT